MRLPVCAALASTAGCVHCFLPNSEYFPTDVEIRVNGLVDQSRIQEVFGDHRDAPRREAILVEVVSRTDWIRRVYAKGASVIFDGEFCDSNRITTMVRGWLFFNGELVGWPLQSGRPNLPVRNEEGLYIVEGYIYVRSPPRKSGFPLPKLFRDDPAQEFYDEYDLETNPRDICVYVSGGTPDLVRPCYDYESNKVRISKATIEAALQRKL